MKDNGLDVKTSGPGRNKAAILVDIKGAWGSPAAVTMMAPTATSTVASWYDSGLRLSGAAAAPAPAAKKSASKAEPAVAEPAPAPAPEAPQAAPPAGFTWGGSF